MVLGTVAAAAATEKSITVTPMQLTINGQAVTPRKSDGTPAEVFAYGGATYVPLRYLSELLGIQVDWAAESSGVARLEGENLKVPVAGGNGIYTASAQGFGGEVTVTITVSGGRIIACTLTGDKETPAIGGAALPQLQEQVLAAGGAGILMALEAGVAPYNLEAYPMSHQRMGKEFITAFEVQTAQDGTLWSPNDLTVILACAPDGVYVTKDGESFRPEDYDPFNPLGGFAGAMGTYSLGASYYVVYSEEQLKEYAEKGLNSNAMGFQNVGLGIPTGMPLGDWTDRVMAQAEKQGFAWKIKTLEEGDSLLGLPAGTLAGAYEDSGKNQGGGYYVMECCGLAISSCGGVEVDAGMRAVRADGSAIENLFVAGNDSFGNIMATGAEYPIGGDAGMWVFGSGYLAGSNAAQLTKE